MKAVYILEKDKMIEVLVGDWKIVIKDAKDIEDLKFCYQDELIEGGALPTLYKLLGFESYCQKLGVSNIFYRGLHVVCAKDEDKLGRPLHNDTTMLVAGHLIPLALLDWDYAITI